MVKKSSVIWICLLLIVAGLVVYNVISDHNEKKKNEELALFTTQSYDINGVKYPSYSQLKYIALNELSHEEVKEFLATCGINQTEASGSSSESEYRGDCGNFKLHIMNSKGLIRYTYTFFTNNRKYLEKLKSEVIQERKYEIDDIETTGYIDDYWHVGISKDIYEGTLFHIFFQRLNQRN